MNKVCLCCGKPLINDNENYWHQKCIEEFFDTRQIPIFLFTDFEVDDLANKNLDVGTSVTGVQPKLSLEIKTSKKLKRKTIINESNYIVKFGDYSGKSLPQYEQLTMVLAKIAGIDVVPNSLIFSNDKYLYITKRIDRNGTEKYPMEDFCQLCEKQTEHKYDSSYEYCYKKALHYSDQKTIDSVKFFNLILFSYLVGNTDMHLKNFSLINKGNGYQLAPAYDLLPTEIIANQNEMALSLNGKRKNITKNDFLVFGETIEIKKEIIRRLIDKMLSNKQKWIDAISRSILTDNQKKEFIGFIDQKMTKFAAKP